MLALPALAFTNGAVEMWVPAAAATGVWLSWTLLAKRLRRYTIEANNVLTIPEFFEVRFEDKTGTLRTLTAFITIFFVVFYVSSGLVGGSKLLETVFGVQAPTGVLLTLVAVASYTMIGGFMAVSRTDVSQALLMLVSLLIITGGLGHLVGESVLRDRRLLCRIPESIHRRRRYADHPHIRSLGCGMGLRRLRRTEATAAFHGAGARRQGRSEPQHLHCLARGRVRACPSCSSQRGCLTGEGPRCCCWCERNAAVTGGPSCPILTRG